MLLATGTRMEDIRETYQNTTAVSSSAVVPYDPEPSIRWVPEMRRIPDYRLDPDLEVREHGGQAGLDDLPLVWEAP